MPFHLLAHSEVEIITFKSSVIGLKNVLVRKGSLIKIIQFQAQCHGQGQLALSQVAQRPLQPSLEHIQGWGKHRLSGKSIPASSSPSQQRIFSSLQALEGVSYMPIATPCLLSVPISLKPGNIYWTAQKLPEMASSSMFQPTFPPKKNQVP